VEKLENELMVGQKMRQTKDHGVEEEGGRGNQARWWFIHELGQIN